MATTKRAELIDRAARSRAAAARKSPGARKSLNTDSRSIALAVSAALLPWGYAHALPTGENVVYGDVSVTRPTSQTMQINQGTHKGIVNWQSFSIGASEHVNVSQLNASSVLLNRVLGNDPSQIFGRLTANGQIFLVNNAGVLFAPGASVNVGALFATSLSISDQDFLAGRYQFSNPGNAGSVINQGHIVTANGYTALVGPQVRNDGVIVARTGSIVLAAADRVSLDMIGDGLISLSVDQATLNASVINTGTLQADGGTVLLAARSANALLDTVINNSGIIRANSLVERNGQIVLDGGSAGVVANSGTLQAAGLEAGTTGGTIKVLGENVGLFGHALVDVSGNAGAGDVRIGGGWQGGEGLAPAQNTFMGRDAAIRADALQSGDGGSVVLWAQQTTTSHGLISVQGGPEGGDGGRVETSGMTGLNVTRAPNLAAPKGKGGLWLLDPFNLTVVAVDIDGNADYEENANVFTSTALLADIQDTVIEAALNNGGAGGATVVLATGASGGVVETGTIDVQAAIDFNATSSSTLILRAHDDVTFTAGVSAAGSALNLQLFANDNSNVGAGAAGLARSGDAVSGNGNVTVNAAISLNGGNFQSNGVAFSNALLGTITTGAGSVNITHTGAVSVGANVSTTNAPISITGAGVSVAAATTVNSGTGALSVNAGAGTLTTNAASLLLTTGTATLTADAMALNAASQVGGTALATGTAATAIIQPSTAGTTIGLAGGAGALDLTAAELNTVRATNVRIGSAVAGAMSVGAWTAAATFAPGTLTLFANGITQTGAINLGISTSDLLIRGAGNVVLDTDNVFSIVAASKSGGSLSITNAATNPLTVGSITDDVGTVNGVTAAGSVSLTASGAGGSLTVNQNIGTTNSNISLTGTGITVATGVSVSSGSGTILIDGNDGAIQLNDSTLTTTNATATAIQIIDGTTAALGNIAAASGTVVLGGAAGDDLSGAVTQNASTAINADTVTVNSGGAVTLNSATNTLTNLGTVTRGGALTVVDSAGGLTLTGSATAGTTTNAVSITTSGGTLALGANAVTGDSVALTSNGATGDITSTAGGTITANATTVQLTAGRSVTLGAAVSATTTTTIDFGQTAAGTFSTNSAIATGTGVTINGGANGDTFDFSGAPAITATVNGAGGNDTLQGWNVTNTWNITASNVGDVGTLNFTAVESLTGGTLDDTFSFTTGSLTGSINGGTGTNSIDISAVAGANAINLQAGTVSTVLGGTFSNVTSFTGDNTADVLVGTNANTTWTISGANDGSTDTGFTFTNIPSLTGGTLNDSFVFAAAGSLTGSINGGTGANSINIAAVVGANTVNLQAGTVSTVLGGTFSNVTSFTGDNTADTVVGTNANTTWTINAQNDGSTDTGFTFTSVPNLTGGTLDDSFVFAAAGSLTGSIDGGTGANSINIAAVVGANTINLQAGTVSTVLGGTFTNVTSFTGDNTADTLVGTNANTTWTMSGANDGSTDTGFTFTNVPNLTGGTLDDSFVFAAAGSLTGLIDGGAHTAGDTANYSAAGPLTVTFGTSLANIESVTGGGAGFTLAGGSTWSITGANSGTVDGIAFTNWHNLTGTAGANSFTLSGGAVTGAISGLGGGDTLAGSTAYSITGSDSGSATGVGSFAGIANLTGTAGADTFTLNGGSLSGGVSGLGGIDTLAGSTSYSITGADSGTATNVGSFTSIENLSGTAGADSFTLAGGSLSGTVNGLGGSDTLAGSTSYSISGANAGSATGVASFTSIETLNGTGGNDTFTLQSGVATFNGTINGGAGSDTLSATDGTNNWVLASVGNGTLNTTTSFTSIETMIGGSGTDNLSGSAPGGTTTMIDPTSLLVGSLNAAGGVVNLTAGSLGGTGFITAGSGTFLSNTNVIGLGINIASNLHMDGAATLYNYGAGSSSGSFSVSNANISVQINGVTFIASVGQQQVAAVIGNVSEQIGAVIVEEANKTFGTDSVAEDVEYGFAGEIGATPPMDHRIDESGISLPRCVQEAREGLPCK